MFSTIGPDRPMWIDTHSHLFVYSNEELPHQIQDAAANDVGIIVSTATDYITARTVIEQCNRYDSVWGAVGISPFDVKHLPDNWLSSLALLLDHPKILAVGEIGIDDTNPTYPPLSLQQPVFEAQLAFAKEHSLPAIVHSRGAESRTFEICKDLEISKVLFHCFTGSEKTARKIVDYGYHISFSGIITFRKSDLPAYIGTLPLHQLHIETDTPYLAPVPYRGKQNRPAWVKNVGDKLADCFGCSPAEMQSALAINFRNFFTKFAPV